MIKDAENHSLKKMIPDFCSQLKTDSRILFGGFPAVSEMAVLQENGVKYIIDLTTVFEKKRLPVYHPKDFDMTYIAFPIHDNSIPHDLESFNEFIVWLSYLIDSLKDRRIYIHCKGGHGRSGLVIASILCFHYNKTPHDAITETTDVHAARFRLSPKWKTRPCPSNPIQCHFIHTIFQSPANDLSQELKTILNSYRRRLLLSSFSKLI